MTSVAQRIVDDGAALTPAERRVAEVVLDDPEVVAFGTVAELARRAHTSGATVVRLAGRIGFNGFVGLQTAVQEELADRLRPATERIREPAPADGADMAGRTLAVERQNLEASLGRIDRAAFERAVALLARRRSDVYVVSGWASSGVAMTMAGELAMVRSGVHHVTGDPVAVAAAFAHAGPDDVVVVIDLRRYDRWVVDAIDRVRAGAGGLRVVAITDSRLSPLAEDAAAVIAVAADGAGPFDSHVGVLAVANAVVNGVAARLRASAIARLDRVEAAWRAAAALTDA